MIAAPRLPSAARRLAGARPRRPRTRTLVLLGLLAALLAGAWLWVRDSSLVRVSQVRITGLTGGGADVARAALRDAALGMTTLDVDEGRLRRVAAAFPAVKEIHVSAQPLHRLTIAVTLNVPVGVVLAPGGRPLAVAPDGTLLPQAGTAGLPAIQAGAPPSGRTLTGGGALAALRVLAAAPAALRGRLRYASPTREHGIVVGVAGGPALYFGPSGRESQKWAAGARLLADPDVAGASYLDLSSPAQPAVGGLAGGATPADAGALPGQPSAGYGAGAGLGSGAGTTGAGSTGSGATSGAGTSGATSPTGG